MTLSMTFLQDIKEETLMMLMNTLISSPNKDTKSFYIWHWDIVMNLIKW